MTRVEIFEKSTCATLQLGPAQLPAAPSCLDHPHHHRTFFSTSSYLSLPSKALPPAKINSEANFLQTDIDFTAHAVLDLEEGFPGSGPLLSRGEGGQNIVEEGFHCRDGQADAANTE